MCESQGTLFQPEFSRSIRVEARRERVSADGGAVVLRELLHRLGLDRSLNERFDDPRGPARTTHPTEKLLRILVLLQVSRDTQFRAVGRHPISRTRPSVRFGWGGRLPKCSTDSFHRKVEEEVPEELMPALLPVIDTVAELTSQIREMERWIGALAETEYPETALLTQVSGVGTLTALCYMLTLETPDRFRKSRSVGPYLGLVRRRHESGDSSPELGITKAGDVLLRTLLVQSAHYILGPFGPDTDLRRWGQKLEARGGSGAKQRAVVAVARKLAVLLHRLWVTGEVYEPLRNSNRSEGPEAPERSDGSEHDTGAAMAA